MQHAVLAIFFVASSFIIHGCGAELEVEVCISDPRHFGMECDDKKKDTKRFLTYAKTENYVCHSERDARTLIDYCRSLREGSNHRGIDVDVCISDPESDGVQCSKSGFKVYEETDNYVCFHPVDYETVVKFCHEGE